MLLIVFHRGQHEGASEKVVDVRATRHLVMQLHRLQGDVAELVQKLEQEQSVAHNFLYLIVEFVVEVCTVDAPCAESALALSNLSRETNGEPLRQLQLGKRDCGPTTASPWNDMGGRYLKIKRFKCNMSHEGNQFGHGGP